jgi:hypothetical protein
MAKKTFLSRVGDFFTSTLFKRFLWNTLAGFLAVGATYVSGLDYIYAPFIFAIANNLTKELNTYITENYG